MKRVVNNRKQDKMYLNNAIDVLPLLLVMPGARRDLFISSLTICKRNGNCRRTIPQILIVMTTRRTEFETRTPEFDSPFHFLLKQLSWNVAEVWNATAGAASLIRSLTDNQRVLGNPWSM